MDKLRLFIAFKDKRLKAVFEEILDQQKSNVET